MLYPVPSPAIVAAAAAVLVLPKDTRVDTIPGKVPVDFDGTDSFGSNAISAGVVLQRLLAGVGGRGGAICFCCCCDDDDD